MPKEVQKAAIKKIILSVGGKEIALSPSEAKELKGILMELFGEEKVIHEHHYDNWSYKHWIQPTVWTPTITWGSTNAMDTANTSFSNSSDGAVYLTATNVKES